MKLGLTITTNYISKPVILTSFSPFSCFFSPLPHIRKREIEKMDCLLFHLDLYVNYHIIRSLLRQAKNLKKGCPAIKSSFVQELFMLILVLIRYSLSH